MSLYSFYTPAILSMQFPEDSVQSLSRVWLFAIPWTAACQTSLSINNSWNLLKLMSIELVMPSNHSILCSPLLLLSSIFPSIRVFSNESTLRMRWPKYWSFSFSISPSNEYSGLISFRIDWASLIAQLVKNSPAMQETLVWFLGLSGRSLGEGKGYLLQYSGLEKYMDCIVHGVAKSQTWPSNFHFLSFIRWLTENVRRYAPEGDCSLLFSLWLSLVLSLLSICLLVSLHPSLQEFVNVFPLHRVPFLLSLSTFIKFTSVYPFGLSLDVTSTGLVLFFPHSSAKLGFPSTYFHSILLLHL